MTRTLRPAAARHCLHLLGFATAIMAFAGNLQAADAVKPVQSKTATKPTARPAPKPATPREQLQDQAQGLALATDTVEQISEAQINLASRVLTGPAQCEFNQTVTIDAVDGRPGHFVVGFKGARYLAVPYETSTGTVRLEDRRAGVVWLQIPSKSMLMNAKIGQRMVDACTHPEQRAAVQAVEAAARAEATTTNMPNKP